MKAQSSGNWLYTPVQVGGLLRRNGFSALELYATSNTIHIEWDYSKEESRIRSLMMRRFGATIQHSTGSLGVDVWILSQQVSHAAGSATRSEKILTILKRIAGHKSNVLFRKCDHRSPFSKMSKGFWVSTTISESFYQTYQKSGIMLNGLVYLLTTPVRHIRERGGSLWPTPTRQSYHPTSDTLANRESPGLGYVLGGKPNPDWVEWLMGWIINWTDMNPLPMGRFLQWLKLHGIGSQERKEILQQLQSSKNK